MCDEEECKVLQEEEVEVLRSIYEGDSAFSIQSDTKFQYKMGSQDSDSGGKDSILLDVEWPPTYPNVLPILSLDAFFNRSILPDVKTEVIQALSSEAEQYLGMSMTYSLFEYAKENLETLLVNQPEAVEVVSDAKDICDTLKNTTIRESTPAKETVKKEQLTKAQKRNAWKKGGLDKGERERGWDWIDVIRHLSQTGSKPE